MTDYGFEIDWWRHRLFVYSAVFRGITPVTAPRRFLTVRGAVRWAEGKARELDRQEHRRQTRILAERAAA